MHVLSCCLNPSYWLNAWALWGPLSAHLDGMGCWYYESIQKKPEWSLVCTHTAMWWPGQWAPWMLLSMPSQCLEDKWSLGTELSSSCLHSKHFIDQAISFFLALLKKKYVSHTCSCLCGIQGDRNFQWGQGNIHRICTSNQLLSICSRFCWPIQEPIQDHGQPVKAYLRNTWNSKIFNRVSWMKRWGEDPVVSCSHNCCHSISASGS